MTGTVLVGGIDSATIMRKTVMESKKVTPRLTLPWDCGGRRKANEASNVINNDGIIKLKM